MSTEERDSQRQREESHLKEISRFVLESERISENDSDEVGRKNHLDIAKILLEKPFRFVSSSIINSALTATPNRWYRTGTDAAERHLVPSASDARCLIDDLDHEIGRQIGEMKKLTEEERAKFAWDAHDTIFAIKPFKQKNSRTARLVLNHVRLLLGLPIHVVDDTNCGPYLSRMVEFRAQVFLPTLAQRIAAAREREASHAARAIA